jgi:predicted component of type VI protein secretion system
MTVTGTLQVPTTEDYDLKLHRIPVASLANFALTDFRSENGVQTATYTYSAGSAADVVTLIAKRSYNAKTNMTNCSIRLTAFVLQTVTETGEETYAPIESVLAWNYQGSYLLDGDFVVDMVSIAVSIFAQELTGANGTPTSKVVDQFDHQVVVELV